jgi:hypothetical protein
MVGKAQKSHGVRSGLYGGCSNGWSYSSTPPIRLHGVVLNLAQGKLYLYLL